MRTKEENICLIQALSNANGVSGFEDEVAELGQKETEAYCNVTIDSLRNTYMSLKNNRKQSCKVWIDAHSDEVGYIVQAIKPNGTMNFLTIGGSDISSLPSNKVRVQTAKGEYIPRDHYKQTSSFCQRCRKKSRADTFRSRYRCAVL